MANVREILLGSSDVPVSSFQGTRLRQSFEYVQTSNAAQVIMRDVVKRGTLPTKTKQFAKFGKSGYLARLVRLPNGTVNHALIPFHSRTEPLTMDSVKSFLSTLGADSAAQNDLENATTFLVDCGAFDDAEIEKFRAIWESVS